MPNKTTADVRAAIAAFANANIDKLQAWLEAIPDPGRRMELYLRVLEYHLPKIARTEISGPAGGAVAHTYRWLGEEEDIAPKSV